MATTCRWAVCVLLALLLPATALGDWATAQSPRGVRKEPNDFWYWHRIGPDGHGQTPPMTVDGIIYDEDHVYQWILGDNYLNMPRTWGIIRGVDMENPVVVATTDTEFMVNHYDLAGNIWRNEMEQAGQAGVDDDGDGFIDNDWPPCMRAQTGSVHPKPGDEWDELEHDHLFEYSQGAYADQHGTNMTSIHAAVTNNEPWWTGRDYSDYIQDLPNHKTGIAGIGWGTKALVQAPHGNNPEFAMYISYLVERGENIRVMSCSWTGQQADWVKRLNAYGVLVIGGSSNTNWEVSSLGNDEPCFLVGGVEEDYRRGRISGVEDGSCYRENSGGHVMDGNAYFPYGGNWFNWSNSTYIQQSSGGYVWTLGWTDTRAASDWATLDVASKALCGFPGIDPNYGGPTEVCMPSDLRTSGATAQAAGVAALLFGLEPELTPEQGYARLRRGCVNIDDINDDTCCTDPDKENCFTWEDGTNGYPLDGVMQDGGFSGSGEITGRIEGDPCAGLLGAGRMDAYRTITLWGLVDVDTTFSGDVYVSGDVLFAGDIDITVEAGTTFHIAPDDITYLDPWDPEDRYDMSDLGSGDSYGYYDHQTAPEEQIEFIFYTNDAHMSINGTAENPVTFTSFVNDEQTADDWIGINTYDSGSILTPNGKDSLKILHSTNGEF